MHIYTSWKRRRVATLVLMPDECELMAHFGKLLLSSKRSAVITCRSAQRSTHTGKSRPAAEQPGHHAGSAQLWPPSPDWEWGLLGSPRHLRLRGIQVGGAVDESERGGRVEWTGHFPQGPSRNEMG